MTAVERIMQISGELILGGVVAGVGALAWLFRLQSRVDVHDSEIAAMKETAAETRDDVAYIRERIDRALYKD